MSLSFQINSVHLSLPLLSFTQWKDKCASYSFTTKKFTLAPRVSIFCCFFFRKINIFWVCDEIVDNCLGSSQSWTIFVGHFYTFLAFFFVELEYFFNLLFFFFFFGGGD